jgi:hemoglobin
MKDIENIDDITLLVNTFYDKVKEDKVIGYIFNQTIGEDWSHHLPVMYNFWNMVLFSAPGYVGSPVKKHVDLDKNTALNKEHFDHWLMLWKDTTDSLFAGEIAEMAKNKAALMANLINMKVEMSRLGFDTLN